MPEYLPKPTPPNGWDPMDRVVDAARITGEPSPGRRPTVIRAMLTAYRLDFSPGERFAYSYLGTCILSRVIEKVSGQAYEKYVLEQALRPAGMDRSRLGRSSLQDRAPGEVRYYDNGVTATSVFPAGPRVVPRPYGGFYLEAMDSRGVSSGLWQVFQTVTNWPAHDLYPDWALQCSRPRLAPAMAVTKRHTRTAHWLATPSRQRSAGRQLQAEYYLCSPPAWRRRPPEPSSGRRSSFFVVPDLPAGDHEVRLVVEGQISRAGALLPVR
jgi:CubicO group peptidase (beta-lactamase class C family)